MRYSASLSALKLYSESCSFRLWLCSQNADTCHDCNVCDKCHSITSVSESDMIVMNFAYVVFELTAQQKHHSACIACVEMCCECKWSWNCLIHIDIFVDVVFTDRLICIVDRLWFCCWIFSSVWAWVTSKSRLLQQIDEIDSVLCVISMSFSIIWLWVFILDFSLKLMWWLTEIVLIWQLRLTRFIFVIRSDHTWKPALSK